MDDISETQAALREAMENERRRLANANQLREFIRQQLAAGITPNHYRIEWIQKSCLAVIAALGDCAAAFNKAYPMDKITTLDLIDVLNTTSAKIISHAQGEG